jgi:hypothetical protein
MSTKIIQKKALTSEEAQEFRKEMEDHHNQKLLEHTDELNSYRTQAESLVKEGDLAGSCQALQQTFTAAKVTGYADDEKRFTIYVNFPNKGVIKLEHTAEA